jgi:hypothetical protein
VALTIVAKLSLSLAKHRICHAEAVAVRTTVFLYRRSAPLSKVMIKKERRCERCRLTSEITHLPPEEDFGHGMLLEGKSHV